MQITILTYGLPEGSDNTICEGLRPPRFRLVQSPNRADILATLREIGPQLVILGISGLEEYEGLEQVRRIRIVNHDLPIIAICRQSSEALATEAFRAGVDDYFKEPFCCHQLLQRISDLLQSRHPSGQLSVQSAWISTDAPQIIGDSAAILCTREYLICAGATQSTVLITGETGTGKDLAARLIHYHSVRAGRPLITINCAAMPESLAESELFGYERGAFTGAVKAHKGKFAQASGSTLFLDEIGDMSPYIQAKILHAIEEKVIYPLGCIKPLTLDVRVVAATNCDLERLVAEQRFRSDLFYRLNIARVHMPPLRERRNDIEALVRYGIAGLNQRFERRVRGVTPDTMAFLQNYAWPGNVRELLNLLESTFINLKNDEIGYDDLPLRFREQAARLQACPDSEERRAIITALEQTNWNKSRAARKLNWSRMTLYRKMTRLKITKTLPPDMHRRFPFR